MRIADCNDFNFAQHLAHDDTDVFVVDIDALRAVHLLDFIHKIILQRIFTEDGEDVVRTR